MARLEEVVRLWDLVIGMLRFNEDHCGIISEECKSLNGGDLLPRFRLFSSLLLMGCQLRACSDGLPAASDQQGRVISLIQCYTISAPLLRWRYDSMLR